MAVATYSSQTEHSCSRGQLAVLLGPPYFFEYMTRMMVGTKTTSYRLQGTHHKRIDTNCEPTVIRVKIENLATRITFAGNFHASYLFQNVLAMMPRLPFCMKASPMYTCVWPRTHRMMFPTVTAHCYTWSTLIIRLSFRQLLPQLFCACMFR